jgi:hypothetical protein
VGGDPGGRANRGRSGRVCARRRFACGHPDAFAPARTLRRRSLVRGHLRFAERRYARRAPPVIGSRRRCAALGSRPQARRSRERPPFVPAATRSCAERARAGDLPCDRGRPAARVARCGCAGIEHRDDLRAARGAEIAFFLPTRRAETKSGNDAAAARAHGDRTLQRAQENGGHPPPRTGMVA